MHVTYQYELDGETHTGQTDAWQDADDYANSLLSVLTEDVKQVLVWEGLDAVGPPDAIAGRG